MTMKLLNYTKKLVKEKNLLHSNSFQLPFCMAVFATFLFVWLSIEWSFCLTAPSDPLQYVKHALNAKRGFPFPLRVVNWLWIRLVATLPLHKEMVGPISTLILSSSTLFAATWWLSARMQILSGAVFASIFIISPAWLPIATYTYPMQGLTFFLVLSLIMMDCVNEKHKSIVGGIGGGLATLCKVQGISFLAFLLFNSSKCVSRRLRNVLITGLSFLFTILAVFALIAIIDGFEQVKNMFETFFGGTGNGQFRGRALGGMPDFHAYLFEPAYLYAFAGMILPWITITLKRTRPFALAAVIQMLSLLAIYFITQRGGPLIPSYVLDAFTLGIISFSASIAYLCKFYKIPEKNQLSLGVILLLVVFATITLWGISSLEPRLYFADHLLPWPIFVGSVIGFIAFIFIFVFLSLQKFYPKMKNRQLFFLIAGLGLVFLSLIVRGGEGIRAAVFRAGIAVPYHEIAKLGSELGKDGVLIQTALNSDVKKVSYKLKRIFNTFYLEKSHNNSSVFFSKAGNSIQYRYILTDQLSEINQFNRVFEAGHKLKPEEGYFQALASNLNKGQYSLRNNGSRGDAQLIWNSKDELLSINPVNSNESFMLLLDLSKTDEEALRTNGIFILHAPNISGPVDTVVKLYVQFTIDGKAKRVYGKKEGKVHSLWTIIPKNAEDIFYGWFVKCDVLNESIILPLPIKSHVATLIKDIENKKFPIALFDKKKGMICFGGVGTN